MKITIAFIALFCLSAASAQTAIDNTKTEQHRQVAGTQFFLIPPPGFVPAANFAGFQQTDAGKSSLVVMEFPTSYAQLAKGFTKEGLKAQGVVEKKREACTVNGDEGLLITAEQFAYGMLFVKYILVFGNEKVTCMVNGMHPVDDKSVEESVPASMKTVVYEPAATADPLEAAPFSIVTDSTKLRFAKSMSATTLVYTVDGKVPTQSVDKTSFTVGISFSDIEVIDPKRSAIDRIKQLPYKEMTFSEDDVKPVTIDDVSGYEIVGSGLNPNTGAKDLVYMVMLFTDNGYYILLGTAKSEFEANEELFRKLAGTFKRK